MWSGLLVGLLSKVGTYLIVLVISRCENWVEGHLKAIDQPEHTNTDNEAVKYLLLRKVS